MFTLLLTERAIFSALYTTFSGASGTPSNDLQIVKERFTADVAVYSLTMALTVFLSMVAFVYAFTFFLYIPLPDNICDRVKIQIFEFLLRLTNEYLGNLVEVSLGPEVRNSLTRGIVAIPFFFKRRAPKWVSVKNETLANVPVRTYVPRKRKSRGLLFFIHGGGWSIMKPAYYDGLMYSFVSRLGMLIVSIDYRLAPEHVFPTAIDDCEAVYMEVMTKKFEEYDFDVSQVFIIGDSAGGNLAAVLAQRILKKDLPKPKCQVLCYPVVHSFDLQSPSYQLYYKKYRGTGMLNPKMMARWFLFYLGIPATKTNIKKLLRNQHLRREQRESLEYRRLLGHEVLPSAFLKDDYEKPKNFVSDDELCKKFEERGYNSDFAPILGMNLEGLCPAMVLTAGYDILRDEGVLYAKHLQSYGIPVLWNHYKSAFHGVLCMPASAQRKQMIEDMVAYIESHLR